RNRGQRCLASFATGVDQEPQSGLSGHLDGTLSGRKAWKHPEFPRRLCPGRTWGVPGAVPWAYLGRTLGAPGPIGWSPPCWLSPSTTRTASSRYAPIVPLLVASAAAPRAGGCREGCGRGGELL